MPNSADPQLVFYRDPRLRTVTRYADPADADLADLAESMAALMKRHDGVGLSAPQVGDDRRLVVVDAPGYRKGKGRRVLLNPVIKEIEDEVSTFQEGCLSFPGIYRDIVRPRAARFGYQELDGSHTVFEDDGLLARILLHEIDHLDGVLFIDHLSGWRRRDVELRMRLRFPWQRAGKGGRR